MAEETALRTELSTSAAARVGLVLVERHVKMWMSAPSHPVGMETARTWREVTSVTVWTDTLLNSE